MTLQDILTGPIAERLPGAVHPMTEAEARGYLTELDAGMPQKRRGPYIRKLVSMTERFNIRTLSPEAVALYRAYAVCYGA